jgi:hypothetical protein
MSAATKRTFASSADQQKMGVHMHAFGKFRLASAAQADRAMSLEVIR